MTTLLATVALALSIAASTVSAQPVLFGPASFRWEVSIDGAVSWRGGVVDVPTDVHRVLIRAVVAFPPEQWRYFGVCSLDATVSHAGPGDAITNWWNLLTGFAPWAARRYGDTLKLDQELDLDPPGAGVHWLVVSQGHPQTLPNPSFANPIVPFAYELALDGTPGERQFDGVFQPDGTFGLSRWIGTYRLLPLDTQAYTSPITDYSPLTIRVVPAPGTVLGVLMATAALCTRRRR